MIKKETIIKSFKITEISNNPDGYEDKLYQVFKWINERVFEKKDDLEKLKGKRDKEDEDNEIYDDN